MIQVADVDTELEGARGHDHASGVLVEGLLGGAALRRREGAVGHEGLDAELQEELAESLGAAARVHENQALLTRVQRANDLGCVLEGRHVSAHDPHRDPRLLGGGGGARDRFRLSNRGRRAIGS